MTSGVVQHQHQHQRNVIPAINQSFGANTNQQPYSSLRPSTTGTATTTKPSACISSSDVNTIGNYAVLGKLAQGGYGAIYRCRSLSKYQSAKLT